MRAIIRVARLVTIAASFPDKRWHPPFPGSLPSTTQQALLFKFSATAASLNNANDYAPTAGAATFTNDAGTTGTIKQVADVEDGITESRLMLTSPSPNPVRSGMGYRIVLPTGASVQVRILDLGGRVVRTLLNQALPAGRHSLAWDASDDGPALSSGLYFLELSADGVRKAQRFALIK